MRGAGLTADRLLHQRAAEVVRTGEERQLGELPAHLDPGHLDVGDPGPEEEPGDGDDSEIVGGRGSGPRPQGVTERSPLVDEAERHELREASGLLLEIAQQSQMGGDLAGVLDVPVHDGGARAEPDRVSRPHDLHPAPRREPAGRDAGSERVVEDLRCGPGDRPQPCILQPGQVLGERHAALLVAEVDLLGGVRVDVEVGKLALQPHQDLAIQVVILAGVDATLDADLGGAAGDAIPGLLGDLLQAAVEGVLVVAVSREAAEAAAVVADVGEVDVPVDDEGDVAAHVLGAGDVGRTGESLEVGTLGPQQEEGVVGAELDGPRELRRSSRATCGETSESSFSSIRRPPAEEQHSHLGRRVEVPPRAPWDRETPVGPGTPRGPAAVRPTSARWHAVRSRSSSSAGQGASGFTKSTVTGDTPPQSLTPDRSSSSSTPGQQVRRRLHLDLPAEHQARQRHPSGDLLVAQRGGRSHPRRGLRMERLDDRLLDVAVAFVEAADGEEGLDPLRSGLADPEKEPAGEGDAKLSRLLVHADPGRGLLVRRVLMSHPLSPQARARGLEHQAHGGVPGAQPLHLPRLSTPALVCGRRPHSKATRQASTTYSAVLPQPRSSSHTRWLR